MSKPSPKPDDLVQYQRFKELAKEIGTDADADAQRKAVKPVAERPPEPRRKLGKKASGPKLSPDWSILTNGPGYPSLSSADLV